jgi:hypothetical protein
MVRAAVLQGVYVAGVLAVERVRCAAEMDVWMVRNFGHAAGINRVQDSVARRCWNCVSYYSEWHAEKLCFGTRRNVLQ